MVTPIRKIAAGEYHPAVMINMTRAANTNPFNLVAAYAGFSQQRIGDTCDRIYHLAGTAVCAGRQTAPRQEISLVVEKTRRELGAANIYSNHIISHLLPSGCANLPAV
jgi:hypothetical protein